MYNEIRKASFQYVECEFCDHNAYTKNNYDEAVKHEIYIVYEKIN
jgi:hypothetical protein